MGITLVLVVALVEGGTTPVLGEGGGPQAACPELSTCPRN